MKINGYDPLVFANLPEFYLTEHALQYQASHIEELGNIFRKHRSTINIGLSVLHKHFNLYANERLIRSFSENTLTIEPKEANEKALIPILWCFARPAPSAPLALYPLEFLFCDGMHAEIYREFAKDLTEHSDFLLDIGNNIERLNCTNLFGIGILPDRLFSRGTGEVLVETEDHDERRLKIQPRPKSDLSNTKHTQTLWSFSTSSSDNDRSLDCITHCRHCPTHCRHCPTHCRHCPTHCRHCPTHCQHIAGTQPTTIYRIHASKALGHIN